MKHVKYVNGMKVMKVMNPREKSREIAELINQERHKEAIDIWKTEIKTINLAEINELRNEINKWRHIFQRNKL